MSYNRKHWSASSRKLYADQLRAERKSFRSALGASKGRKSHYAAHKKNESRLTRGKNAL